MNVGTKSILFGVHQFLWHPWTVGLAWRSLYKRWPCWWEWVAIFCHDLGYWGCPNMDGAEGRKHPIRGAEIARSVVAKLMTWRSVLRHPVRSFLDEPFQLEVWKSAYKLASKTDRLCIGHSRFYAKEFGVKISPLYRADKVSIFFDPELFYLIRARSSGEVWEYLSNSPLGDATLGEWFNWYRGKIAKLL